ncbi:MAG TPA: glycine betaine ABC transporter substrate-binding protein [Solirubrobacteraceae bacterium]|jgi:osmoprotectant transport system substrate-binding protein|nr:glycine betaine ABC transporter substrate-binding protein [Solirubrobacteraceae bacterium]
MFRPPSVLRLGPWLATALVALGVAACGDAGTTSSTPAAATRTPTSSTTTSTSTTQTSTTTSTTSSALPGAGKPVINLGDKNYTEQFVLGQLYAQALRAEGYSVNVNQNIGPTDVTVQALKAGTLTMYPEYLDTFTSAVAGYRHSFRSELDAYQAAQRWALGHGLQLLAPTPFSDTEAIAVTDAYASANHLRSIGDLTRIAPAVTIGGPPQFQQGTPGLPDLAQMYGVIPSAFRALAVGDQYAALNDGSIQAADVDTTDGQLASQDYLLLRDPLRVFGWGNVVPVISAQALIAEGPAFGATIQRVDDELSTAVMRRLNQAVDVAGEDPGTVARTFLETHGLLTPAAS